MKSVGTIADRDDAALFQAYLNSAGFESRIDFEQGTYEVWVYDDDHQTAAREELQRFLSTTDRTAYQSAAAEHANAVANRRRTAHVQVRRLDRPRRDRPALSQLPVTTSLIGGCVLIFLLTGSELNSTLASLFRISTATLSATAIDSPLPFINYGRLPEVAAGQWWRLITPILLHMNILHIFFNLMWLMPLGSAIEHRKGSLTLAWLVLSIALVSNVVQFVYAGPYFMGISGVVAGLFGYLLVHTRLAPESGLYIDSRSSFVMLLYLGLCLTPLVPDVANGGHLAGLAMGVGLAALSIGIERMRDASKRE